VSLRELAGAALSAQNLAMQAHVEGPADIVAAIASAPPLGRALWRYAYSRQDDAARHVAQYLVHDCMHRYRWAATAKTCRLAMLAVYEWTEPNCRICGGRRGYMLGQRWLGCPICRESGLRRFSNNSRRRFMGEWDVALDSKLYLMLRMLTDTDATTMAVVRAQLGRCSSYLTIGQKPTYTSNHQVNACSALMA